MNIYRSGSLVVEEIPLIDESGLSLDATSVSYRVTDESGTEITPFVSLSGFTAGDASALMTIPVLTNTLSGYALKGLRVIELRVTLTDTRVVFVNSLYGLDSGSDLVTMTNSYQTLNQAKLLMMDMPDMLAINASSDKKVAAAMTEAFYRIGRLKFDIYGLLIPSRENTVVTNKLNLDLFDTQAVSYYRTRPSLSTLPLVEFVQLPILFTDAVKKAQISEADIILGGDPMAKKREEGIVSDAIGESRSAFRNSTPLSLSVSKRTMGYLSGWVTYRAHLGR
jgi:hypothetical protein